MKDAPRHRLSWQMALPLPWILALRYLKSARRDAYVSLLSALATGGIALGVAALVVVLAALSGLQDFLRSDVLARTPHLEVEVPPEADSEALRQRLAALPGILEAQRLLRGRGWLVTGGTPHDVAAVGFEGHLPRSFPGVISSLGDSGGIYIGDDLAARMGLALGDVVEIVSPRPTLTPLGPQPHLHALRLEGTFRAGRTEEPRVALPLEVAGRLFGTRLARLELTAAGLEEALELAPRVAALLPEGGRVRTWRELNRALFFILKLEKMLMFVSVFLIVVVAGLALVTVLVLLISSKRGEIGMLQAMGAHPGELRRTFLCLGAMLALLGLTAGGTLGVCTAWLLDHYRLIAPPGEIYFVDHVPFLIQLQDLLAIGLSTAVLTAISTAFAARRAAALKPVEALRN